MVTMDRLFSWPLSPTDPQLVIEEERTSEHSALGGRTLAGAPKEWVMPRVTEENPHWTHELEPLKPLRAMALSSVSMLGSERFELVNKSFQGTIGTVVPSLRSLESAGTLAGLVDAARMALLDDAAEQVERLIPKLESDPDADQFSVDAVRHALLFLARHRELPVADIGVVDQGMVDLSWSIPPDGVVFVEIGEAGQLEFALNVPEKIEGRRQRVSGATMNPDIVACLLGQILNAEGAR